MMKYFVFFVALWCAVGAAAQQQVPQSAAQVQLSFVPLVRQSAPAVVNIYAKIMSKPQATPLRSDPFFERFFRNPGMEKPRAQNSLGSGVILSADGIVVSNFHVVGMATDIRVVLADRREYSARVLLGDADNDLAILQLEGAEDLPYLPLRGSDSVEVGELALAIGNPFGVGQTVTSGIVSGLARSGAAAGTGRGYFIQTDAPINPGNSGGALIDVEGRLLGINTSILTRSGGSNGIGFAIPADLVAAFVEQAHAGKTVFERPWAGMSGQPLDADMAASLGLDRPEGIIVSGLHPVSPFLRADVLVGDVITAVNGQSVNTPSEMVYRMSVTGLGKSAKISRLREGQVKEVAVELIAAPDVPPRDAIELDRRTILPGLVALRVNPAVISEFNLPLDAEGVVVADAGPVAVQVGFRPGDIVLEINNQPVGHPADLVEAFGSGARAFGVLVQRGGQRIALQFRI
jgi:Do/DeqQ family serine protease